MVNLSLLFAYPANLVNQIIGSSIWGFFGIIAPLLLTSKTSSVLGWSRADLLVLAAAQSIFLGFFDFFFARNIDRFPRYVERGELDGFLLKPISDRFILSLLNVNYGGLIRLVIGLGFLLYLLVVYQIPITLTGIFFFIIALGIGSLLLYGIWFSVIILTIWFTRLKNLVDLLYTIRGVTRYPQEIFREVSIYLFVLLFPITIVVARPTEFLLLKHSPSGIFILFLLTVTILCLSQLFWRFALRFYSSASS